MKTEYAMWMDELEKGPARFPVIKFTLAIVISVAAVGLLLTLT